MNPSTTTFVQCLQSAISFPKTNLGNRQRKAWERLINYLESSGSPSEFDKNAAHAEGYAQALVDSELIDISTERDVQIIVTTDEWRRNHFLSTFPTDQ